MRVPTLDSAGLALALLDQFTTSPERLGEFLDATGMRPDALRAGLADGSLQAALCHFLLGHEDVLLEVAAALGQPPEVVAAVANREISAGRPGAAGS